MLLTVTLLETTLYSCCFGEEDGRNEEEDEDVRGVYIPLPGL